ncbi:hypothetical protein PQZ11_08570 [Luminiphilus sp.]|jgi:hypothetical protein|nr:hypothetical protein [Luminiphilus sp.]MDB2364675.1 hypothetical protein [Luminiphilus sp.]MDC1160942.1 hypothetical protein [Luminiphilus sp.]MDC6473098.1 hypothetical protein [Luminiphilus sp.]|tara:strand:+ start:802 stop:1434 length:633 start_codon:yes stop_codon:yes gene_type:complete
MTSRRKLWLGSVLLYALFVSWYTDFGGPLTEAEIQDFVAKTDDRDLGGIATRKTLLEFLRNDTGRQFLMINAVDLAKNPPTIAGAPPNADAQTLIDLYMEYMIPELLSNASHPVVVGKSVGNSLDLLGIEGAEQWSDGAVMRYRSRRTLMDIISNPEFYDRHDFKLAGLEKTIAYPIEPRIHLGDLRLMLGLLLLAATALIDGRLARRQP